MVLTAIEPIIPFDAPLELEKPAALLNSKGNLVVRGATGSVHNNEIVISKDEFGNLLFTDQHLSFGDIGQITGAELSTDQRTLKVPESSLIGKHIYVFGGACDDTLTFDLSQGNFIPVAGLTFFGGAQNSTLPGDQIVLTGGTVENVDYEFVTEHDGSITVDGRRINYEGLEPVTDNMNAANRSFTFTSGTETVTIADVAGAGLTRIDSNSGGEMVDFAVPTNSLTVIVNGGDTVNINSFDAAFNSPLISLQGTGGANSYNLGAANVIPNVSGLSLTGDANFSLNGFDEQIASLASTDAIPSVNLTGGQTLTVGDAANTTFSGALAGAGNLTKVGAGTLTLSGTSPTYSGTNTINAGVLQINLADAAGTGPTTINTGGVFEVNNVTHNAPIALNNGGTLRGRGTARENGVVTVANGGAVTIGTADAATVFTMSDAANDLTGGNGTTITINGGGVVALTQNANLGVAATPVRWTVDSSTLSITAALQLGINPTAHTPNFMTLNNGTLRNAATANIDLLTTRGFTLTGGGGTIANTATANITISGRVSGAAPLNVMGLIGPALILNGNGAGPNQFTQLNIDGTRFFFNANINALGGAAGTAPISIVNAGQFGLVSNSAVITVNNPISMAAGTKMVSRATGANSLVLSGPVTLPTAGTIIFGAEGTANGLINMTNPANALALTGNLTIQVGPNTAGPGQVNINHDISGTGGLIKTNTGAVQISGANTYDGSTTVTQGTMLLGANNTLPVTTPLTVGTGSTVGTLNMQTFNQTVGSLSSTSNAAGINLINIGAGRTLTVNGNLVLSNNTDTAQTNLTMDGGGTLEVNGTNVLVGNNTTAATSKARLNLAALAAVNMTMTGAITVQADGDNGPADFAILTLSNTANTLITPTLTVGGSAAGSVNQLVLGDGTNLIRANTFNIGIGGRDSGTVTFATAAGTLTVRDQAGTGAANFNMGTGAVGTGLGATNEFNVAGHNADLLLGAVAIATQPRSASIFTNEFSFDTGTLTMTSLIMGTHTQTSESGNGTGGRVHSATMNLGGGTVNIANGITAMGRITGDDYTDVAKSRTINTTLNISGGTVNIGETGGNSIVMAGLAITGATSVAALSSNATINISGGTVTVAGNIIRGAFSGTSTGGTSASATINLTGGTLDMTNHAIGAGTLPIVLNKSTASTARILGANDFVGTSNFTAGTLFVNGFLGALTTDAGTTLNPGNGPGISVGVATIAGNYLHNGALNIEIASPTNSVAGTDYDQVRILENGSVTFGPTATLSVTYTGTPGTFVGNTGQLYVIVENDGTNSADTIGTFLGLAEGATVTVDGMAMMLSYVGGDGNDVTLSAVGGPPPIIYIDDDFPASGTVDGDLENPGSQNAVMGTGAFQSIAAALTQYPTFGGLLVVNGGTYATANLAGGGNVTLRLVQDLINAENNVTLQNLTGDAADSIVTRYFNAANANLIVEQGNFNGVISGSGDLTKTSTGSLTLGGLNTYTGTTTIAAGAVVVGVDNALPNGPLVMGSGTTVGTLNLTNASQTMTTLNVNSNVASANNIIIGNGRTLTNTGNVVLGQNAVNIIAQLTVAGDVAGNGTWTVNNTAASGLFALGAATGATNHNRAVLDLTNLGTFTANLTGATSAFRVGDVGTTGTGAAASSVLLAPTSTIIANSVLVGTGSGSGNAMLLRLGTGTQVIQTNNLEVAHRGGSRSSGTVDFRTANGSLTLRGQAGGSSAAALRIGVNSANTGGALTGLVNFLGHQVDARFSTVDIGLNSAATTGNAAATHTHSLSFDTGTLAITGNVRIGNKTGTWQHNNVGNLNLAGGTITIGGTVDIGAHTTTAGTLAANFNISGTANVTIGNNITLGSKITNAGGTSTAAMNISGGTVAVTGNITLGNQTVTGTLNTLLNVTGGSLSLTGNILEAGTGDAISTLLLDGGTLDLNGGEVGDTIPLNNVTLQSGTLDSAGEINDGAALSKTTAGTLTITGTNTFTGATTVVAGTMAVTGTMVSAPTVQTGATLTGTGTTGLLTVDAGGIHAPGTNVGTTTVMGNYVEDGALQIQIGSASGTVAGTDYDQVRVQSSGSVAIGAAATLNVVYTGTAGTFAPVGGQPYVLIDNDGTAAADTTGTFAGLAEGATVTVDGQSLTISYIGGDGNDVVLNPLAATVLYVDDDFPTSGTVDGDLETAGMQSAVMGTTGFLTVAAALAANPGFSGTIVVNGGTYASVLLAAGGDVTLRLMQDLTNNELNVTFTSLSGSATDEIVTRYLNAANANLIVTSGSFGGVISGTGDVIKSGTGTVILSGTNTYSGLTNVQAGILQITNASALGTTAGATTVQSGGQLQLNAVTVTGESVTITGQGVGSVGALNGLGASTWAGPVIIGAGTNNRVGSTGGTLTLSGVISGGQAGTLGGLTVRSDATGVVVVSGGSNSYLGDTTVVVGTLRLSGGANRLPVGTKLAFGNNAGVSPAIVDLNGQNQTVAGLYSVAGANVTMRITSTAAATLTVDGPLTGTTDTYGGTITGAVSLTKTGTGTLALTSMGGNTSNTYTGTTLVSGGRLHLAKASGQDAIPGQFDITTGGQVTFGASNQIADTASVNVSGATSVFNGTGINAGQLTSLQETIANLTVTGGTFQSGAGSNWNITGTGSFTGGAGNTLFLGNSGTTIAFGGLTLNNMTTTPGGTVQTNNSFAIYGASPTIGTITVGAAGLTLIGSVLNLRQSTNVGDAGSRLVLDGNVTSSGTSSILLDAAGGTNGVSQVELSSTAAAANRTFNLTGTLTVSVPITNGAATPGSITKAGAGTLLLSGANTYTGVTNVNAGVVQLAGGAAIVDSGVVNVGLGGTLQLLASETIGSYVGAGEAGAGANDSTLALGAFTLSTTGSAAIANVTSSGGAIVAGDAITDADDDNNVSGSGIVLTAVNGVGTAIDPLETTLGILEAQAGSGVFIANTGNLVIGGIGALVGVSAASGDVSVSSAGSLTVNENVTASAGDVTLATIDAAAVGQDLIVSATATVSSTSGTVTLNAGDNATISGNLSSGTTTTVNVDATNNDALGGVFSLTGTITAPGGAFLNGDTNNDTFNLRPQAAAVVTVNGQAPHLTLTGDVLNLDLTGAVNQQLALGSIGSGVWTFDAPLQTVNYISIEEMNANLPYHLTLDANTSSFGNTNVPDLITVRLNGANLVVERTGSAAVPDDDDVGVIFQGRIAQIQSFTYIGSADDDTLTISDVGGLPQFGSTVAGIPDNANIAGVGSILLDGNGGSDSLVFNLTGANAALTYAIGNGTGAAGNEGEVLVASGGLALQAYFVETELAERTGTGAAPGGLQVIGDSSVNNFAITASGGSSVVSATGYTPLSFTGNNFTALTIDGLDNNDVLELVSFGTDQLNSPTITLNGNAGDDTLRVHSTSGNSGLVTLTGHAGNDAFVLQSSANTVDGIVGQVIVDGTDGIVANNNDTLTIVDSGDADGDTVFINAVSAGTSSDYRVEGISTTGGDDVIFRNIDTLTYTGTAGDDTIDAQFTNTSPAHDLSVATINGWLGGDQFLLFTSDQVGGTSPTPTGIASGLAVIALNGDAPGNPNAGDGNDIFGETAPGIVGTGSGNAGLTVASSVRGIRPSVSTGIVIDGGQPTAPIGTVGDFAGDVLNLDFSGVSLGSSFVLATLSGVIASPGLQPLSYTQIEDLNFISNNQLMNLEMGDTLVRGTSGQDSIIFSRNPTPTNPTGTRVRLNTTFVDFAMSGKTLTFAGASNDYITHANVTFPMESHGEDGDDYISGGMGNDFLVGGLGNDQINASGGDNIVWGDEAPSDAQPLPQNLAIGGNDTLSALGGNDVFYGGGGNDLVSPGAGNDYLHGGEGDDLLDGSEGDDRIYGGGGNDVLSGSAGNDLLSGGSGNDLLIGGDGNDVLFGGAGADNINGGGGDDLIISGSVANESSNWTSSPVTSTFGAGLYSRPTDNDAALLLLLTQWSSSGNRSSLAAVSSDAIFDTVWGYTGNDDFATSFGEIQDLNANGMGNDELI